MEKLSPKESVKGAHTVLRGSARAPNAFLEGKPEAKGLPSSCPYKAPSPPSSRLQSIFRPDLIISQIIVWLPTERVLLMLALEITAIRRRAPNLQEVLN